MSTAGKVQLFMNIGLLCYACFNILEARFWWIVVAGVSLGGIWDAITDD